MSWTAARGDDVLVYDAADSRFDGGTGTDTLRVDGAGEHIDLTEDAGNRILGIEKIDLTGTGANELTTDEDAVMGASDAGSLIIHGDGGRCGQPVRVLGEPGNGYA